MRDLIVVAQSMLAEKKGFPSFNKYNAPEVMAHLLAVLAQEGLKDAANQIRMKKIPELVDKAWKTLKEAEELEERLQGPALTLWRMLSPFTRSKKRGVLPVSSVSKIYASKLVQGGHATKTGSSFHLTKKGWDELESLHKQLTGYL
jgi:hypothetical protein